MSDIQSSNREQGMEKYFFRASAEDFKKIPGSPIAYWVSARLRKAFEKFSRFSDYSYTRIGLITGDNDCYIRQWNEVSFFRIGFNYSREEAKTSGRKWFPQSKGGDFRRWYGNNSTVLNWFNDGHELQTRLHESGERILAHNFNLDQIFEQGITWTKISSGTFAARYQPKGFLFNDASANAFPVHEGSSWFLLALLVSKIPIEILKAMNPTLNFLPGNIAGLPISPAIECDPMILRNSKESVQLSKADWDSYETSWHFTRLPLLHSDHRQPTLKATYQKLRAQWLKMTLEMQQLEEENNRIFIEAYGLQDELTPEVPLNEITLTCNPNYRYGVEECEVGSEKWEEMETRLLQDTMKELVSYAVGCMFGRYSLDMPGLVLANQGESISDYYRKVTEYQKNECEKLSRVDCLAEGDGFGGNDIPGDATVPEGGIIWSDQPDSPSSSLDSIQYSGGASQTIDGGVQKLSVDSAGFQSGSGNAIDDRTETWLSATTEGGANSQSVRGNKTHDLLANIEAVEAVGSEKWEAGSKSLSNRDSSHSPLPTFHFLPDEDNVIPILDGDWFPDDITERFRQFLRVAFGEEHYEENLKFVEQALNVKGKRGYTLRDYFLGEFYTDHVKRYKKRPIYWLFSSPKGSFNALIYLHRYRQDTVSVVLNDYLREFRTKLTAHKNHLEAVSISASAAQGEKTKALKEIEKINKTIVELEEYEREVLYPLATRQIQIDLDDGVKANYPKFGAALKKIPGLDAQDE
jgi:hypothetical protein